MNTPHVSGSADPAPATRAPLLVSAILVLVLAAGCSRAPASRQTTAAPTDLATAERLLQEKRVAFRELIGHGGAPAASKWRLQASGTSQNLFAVACEGTQSAWAVGDSGTILHTADGGVTWTTQSSETTQPLEGVTFSGPNTGWAVGGYVAVLLHTTDAGATWASQSLPTTQQLDAVSFPDSHNGWVVGGNGTILHTTDGGATWVSQDITPTIGVWAVDFADLQHGFALGDNDVDAGVILRTVDGGTTWQQVGETLYNGDYIGLAFADADHGWVVGEQNNAPVLARTADGGASWLFSLPDAAPGRLSGICFSATDTAYAVGQGGRILSSDATAAVWTALNGGTAAELRAVTFADEGHGWAVGALGTILRYDASTPTTSLPGCRVDKSPAGSSYTLVRRRGTASFGFSASVRTLDGATIVGKGGGLQKSADGLRWTDVRGTHAITTDYRGVASTTLVFNGRGTCRLRWVSLRDPSRPVDAFYQSATSSVTRIGVK